MLYYIEAKVSMKVAGISGPFEEIVTWLVNNVPNVAYAKQKYESQVRRDFAHIQAQSFEFKYIKIAGELP